ncbi:MAG: hypothetical protein WBC96_09710, partial [Thermodesulfobacteriota bacterium]
MKKIRDLQNNAFSRLFIPALAVLFVFSLTFHNHSFSSTTTDGLDSHSSEKHSIEDCSACLLQGNLQPPETGFSFNNNKLGLLLTTISI